MRTVRHILEIKGNDIWSIGPNESVYDALRMMANKDVGALVVMDDDKMVGILSERDYARKIILHGKTSKDTQVQEVMTSRVYSIHPDQTIEEAMELMTRRHIRHLPVVEDERVIGVISLGDAVNDIIFRARKTISNLEDQVLTSSGVLVNKGKTIGPGADK